MTTPTTASKKTVRCAIYTRKSTEEGLDQDFNTLDAQREGGMAFIASQKAEGWVCLPDRYDDGGFTGGNIERPALKRLMADIETGKVNCVVVYKVDRLSRSLMDFARLMELFDRKGVSFVSVTQQFNTTHSMGRLTLNILLSFAQFEREIISERTRDKIAAARRKGKYALGRAVLGYDFIPVPAPMTGKRLVVNPKEAERVREIFDLYLELKSTGRVAAECNARGWKTKSWTTAEGVTIGGGPFDKNDIAKMIRCPLYIGRVPHRGESFPGEHEAIIDEATFARAGAQLKLGALQGGSLVRSARPALLRRLVRCRACSCGMTPTVAKRTNASGGERHHIYYKCGNASRRGPGACPSPSVPGSVLEPFIVEQVKAAILASDDLVTAVVAGARERLRTAAEDRAAELDRLRAEAALGGRAGERAARQATALAAQVRRDRERLFDEDELVGAVETFDRLWDALTGGEQDELIRSVVAAVEFDAGVGDDARVTVTLRELAADPTEMRPIA